LFGKPRVAKYEPTTCLYERRVRKMNNGRKCQTRGATRDVVKVLGKGVCANGKNRWQKSQNSGVL